MEFRILGPVEAWDGARRLALAGPKPSALLAVLLLHANRVVPTDNLVDDLWGELPPSSARNLVQVYVSRLRQVLHRDGNGTAATSALVTRPSGYLLHVEPGELDLDCFERLADGARRATADGDLELAADRPLRPGRGAPPAGQAGGGRRPPGAEPDPDASHLQPRGRPHSRLRPGSR